MVRREDRAGAISVNRRAGGSVTDTRFDSDGYYGVSRVAMQCPQDGIVRSRRHVYF